ncbi:MAG TPA: ATP-binding protein [Polyangia bacterium]|nr:ATP-binding protein [Polyangia bacterium]
MSPLSGSGDGKSGDAKGDRNDAKSGPEGKSGKSTSGRGSSSTRRMKSSSGSLRQSSIFRAAEWLGRGASVWSLPVSAALRRHGLRRRLSAVLIIAALGPVIAVSAVAVLLIFSSVEQGIEFEAVRGLQVARGLFLQQVQQLAAGAAALGDDAPLLRAQAAAPTSARQRLGELSLSIPNALFETTDATGKVVARCTRGTCEDAPSGAVGALEPADRSPVIRDALAYERTVSVERARDRLVVRAALPLVDPAMRMLGTAVVTEAIDGSVVDKLKAALGAGREVVVYAANDPNASTFMAATGARLLGPALPADFKPAGLATGTTVVTDVKVESHPYSLALGQLKDVTGRAVGLLGVAVDREPLAAARRRASTALILGALSALLLAMVLSNLLARRMTRPLQNLHAGALAIARGDLDTSFAVDTDDEIGDVAEAFRIMTRSLRENQEGLAARVRELVTVHQVGRAVSSVVDLGQVLRAVITEILNVLGGKTVAIALAVEGRIGDVPSFVVRAVAGDPVGERLARLAGAVAALGRPRRTPAVEADPQLMDYAESADLRGPVIAAPLTIKERMVGVIIVGRLGEAPFGEADLRLLVTFADQTATAIENARLYTEVRAFSEVLEARVRARTAELEKANTEIERTLRELGEAQGQLIHSEKMAGLGMLVAGIAHEVNSPAAAVQGLVDALQETVRRLSKCARDLYQLGLPPSSVTAYFTLVDGLVPEMMSASLSTSIEARQQARRLKALFANSNGGNEAAGLLAEVGTIGERIAPDLRAFAGDKSLVPLVGYLRELAFLARTAGTIRTAIGAIRRIVGALKRYSRLDEAPLERVDVHAGIEDTLIILSHQLKYGEDGVTVRRSFGALPPISAYVGELNQVWTNLIHDAIQAMDGRGEILIETNVDGAKGEVEVAIQDSGPGIEPEVAARIFEPFFTTKEKGEGTGLGLSISARIVEKHGGKIRVDSRPGRTRFEVRLPIDGPSGLLDGGVMQRSVN